MAKWVDTQPLYLCPYLHATNLLNIGKASAFAMLAVIYTKTFLIIVLKCSLVSLALF